MKALSNAELKTAQESIDVANAQTTLVKHLCRAEATEAYRRGQRTGFAWGFFWTTVFWAIVLALVPLS